MHSESEYQKDVLDVPDDAPEADVLEQFQSSAGQEDDGDDTADVPVEANPADVGDQRRSVGGSDEDDYR